MIAYHYSATYTDAPSLIRDYRKVTLRVQPMLKALQKGRDWFEVFLLHEQYLAQRAAEQGGFRNYEKDATEAVFEYIRQREFAGNSISRIDCVYFCRDLDDAIKAVYADWLNCEDAKKEDIKMLEVRIDDDHWQEYDQVCYDEAYELMKTHRITEAMDWARRYFSGYRTEKPLLELLSNGENQVLRRIEY